jgi:hypothetical protein
MVSQKINGAERLVHSGKKTGRAHDMAWQSCQHGLDIVSWGAQLQPVSTHGVTQQAPGTFHGRHCQAGLAARLVGPGWAH